MPPHFTVNFAACGGKVWQPHYTAEKPTHRRVELTLIHVRLEFISGNVFPVIKTYIMSGNK